MPPLIALALIAACAACAGESDTAGAADLAATAGPPPPFFLVAQLPGEATPVVLPRDPTAHDLPILPLVLGGQGFWMVIPRVAAAVAWPGRLRLKLWLERDGDGYPLQEGAQAQVKLEPTASGWSTPDLPLILGQPCAAVGHVVHARVTVYTVTSQQDLDGVFRVSWPGQCP